MGNLCSKSSNKPDHFAQPGRVLGSSGQSVGTAPTPRTVTSRTPGRTLGGKPGTASDNTAKSAAARAAEVYSFIPPQKARRPALCYAATDRCRRSAPLQQQRDKTLASLEHSSTLRRSRPATSSWPLALSRSRERETQISLLKHEHTTKMKLSLFWLSLRNKSFYPALRLRIPEGKFDRHWLLS
jgi:hypothetical protein